MKNTVFGAVIGLVCMLADTGAAQQNAGDALVLSTIGTCESRAGPVDLAGTWFIENREVTLPSGVELRLSGQSVAIESSEDVSRARVYDVSAILGEGRRYDPDVDLKFVLVRGALAVYWREPAFHRQYRQGLFRVDGTSLVQWCQGLGGISQSH